MPHFFSIIIDKSVLQGLNARESKWLFHHYRVNMTPIFFSEILGDLKKVRGFSTESASGDVQMLSKKIDSSSVDLNEYSDRLVMMELSGRSFPLDGRPVVANAQPVRHPDGGYGMFIDQTPMQKVLNRWVSGDFVGMEEEFAKVWRERIDGIDLNKIIQSMKTVRDKDCSTPLAVMNIVDTLLFKPSNNYANLMLWMDVLGMPANVKARVATVWKGLGRPNTQHYAPYTAYVARLELYFHLGVGHHVIPPRPTNRLDIDYFKYLPFTRVFASADKFHADHFSLFSRSDQIFLTGKELKDSLSVMADYYDNIPENVRSRGSYTYADFPPVHMDNAITRTYDLVIPGWREGANMPRPPRDPAADAKIMKELKPIMDAINAQRMKG